MKKIKKISVLKNNTYFEIPGAKFRLPIGCDDTTCSENCAACEPGNDDNNALQFIITMNDYCDHKEIHE